MASSIPPARALFRRCWTCSPDKSPLPCNSSKACALCTKLARASSWKSAQRRLCKVSLRMSSAATAMWFHSSPIIPSSATSHRSTRRYAAFTPQDWAAGPPQPQPRNRQHPFRWHQRRPKRLSPSRSLLPQAPPPPPAPPAPDSDHYTELGRFFAEVLERGWQIHRGQDRAPADLPVVITGAALGLPGTEHIFDDANLARILRGDQFIDLIPPRLRKAMLDKHITRLVKSDNGGPTFETISNVADVIKLAGRGGVFDLEDEFGISADRLAALDRATQ